MNYPSPCIICKCDCGKSRPHYLYCARYRTWINTWWLRFNAIYHKLCRARRTISQKFLYEHPDEVRRYLRDGPCTYCKVAGDCETPCAAYWQWWDARQEWHRRRLGL